MTAACASGAIMDSSTSITDSNYTYSCVLIQSGVLHVYAGTRPLFDLKFLDLFNLLLRLGSLLEFVLRWYSFIHYCVYVLGNYRDDLNDNRALFGKANNIYTKQWQLYSYTFPTLCISLTMYVSTDLTRDGMEPFKQQLFWMVHVLIWYVCTKLIHGPFKTAVVRFV